ncbi:MAG: signal peptide peptidase SppA [Flavobacteriales bacterium]|nr:signal peptide peptidase SppA [Flavobacteriales bacterium]|tara:strand:- start:7773 stop:9494 length:1722 start_codon:yes stop_codon:yes gene_type:complete
MKKFLKNTFSRLLSIIIIFIFFLVLVSVLIPKEKEIIVKKNSILKIKLDKNILDRTSGNPLPKIEGLSFSTADNIELKQILDNIEKAKLDERITGIYLNLSGLNAGLTNIEEIREKLLEFKKTGKFIYSYSEVYTQLSYYLSSVSDSIFLNPQGMIEFNGFSAGVLFYKEFLDKIGYDVQVIRHGKFKSAVEPYMYNGMSDENREQLEKLLNSMSDVINEGVSKQRSIKDEKINEIINNLQLNSPQACMELNFVDDLRYEDEVLSLLQEKSKNLIEFQKYLDVKSVKSISENKIALIYATGAINTGKGSYNSIGSETTVKAIREAAEDEKVKAIVFRVNSPGGSALASDIILRELNLAKQKKKIVVSMGDYAASGGYYISCNADKIFANHTTLTGSIGVFGILPNSKRLLNDKLGVYIDTVNTHKYSDLGRGNRRLTNFELDVIQESVEDVYETFITHVSEGRGMSKRDVDNIGQGRVWSGIDALEIGLIDEIGGLEDAIVSAAELSDLEDYRVVSLPKKTDEIEELLKGLTMQQNVFFQEILNISDETFKHIKLLNSGDKIQAILPYIIEVY